jgi:6-phosphogluconolactonase
MKTNVSRALLSAALLSTFGTTCGQRDDGQPGGDNTPGAGQKVTVFMGTYTRGWACPPPAEKGGDCTSKGIYRASFDTRTGVLGAPVLAAESDNPSYLTVSADGKYLFAVNEVDDYMGEKSGAVSAFEIDASGSLRPINQLSSHGADPCHLSVSSAGTTLLVANYSGGNVSSYRIGANGALSEGNTVADIGERGPHMNQDGAHAHYIVEGPTPGLVYVADLGLDKVFLYDLDPATSKLSPHAAQPFVAVTPPGSGPRHIAIHPNKKFLYTNNELATAASVFARNPDTGALNATSAQTLSTIPLPFTSRSNNAEILISSDGRFAYVSNRGHDSINTFSVDQNTGQLTTVENLPSGGKEPRDFKIDPTGKWILVGHQISDDVTVFAVDNTTGKLERKGNPVKVSKVVNVAFWSGRK